LENRRNWRPWRAPLENRHTRRLSIALAIACTIFSYACSPFPDSSKSAGHTGGNAIQRRLEIGEAYRAGYVAAGLEAGAYVLLASQSEPLRDRGLVLLSLADRAMTSTLSSALPLDQEIYVTDAWNAWRHAQLRFLGESTGFFRDPTALDATEIPPEAQAFGEYMQAAWGDARAHVVAAYLWSSTQSLKELVSAVCASVSPTSVGQAVASSITWHEQMMRYLVDTSADSAIAEFEPLRPEIVDRLRASGVAAGVASAAVSKLRRHKALPDLSKMTDKGSSGCDPQLSGDVVFEAGVSSVAASLHSDSSEIYESSTEVIAELEAIESGNYPSAASMPSTISQALYSLFEGDASEGYLHLVNLVGSDM
jgi:hypothetical protein